MLEIQVASDFTALSDAFFATLAQKPGDDPLAAECVIVPTRIAAAWLRHRWVLEARRHEICPHWDVYFLHVFVNDCLAGVMPGSGRVAEAHPYYRVNLCWRLYDLLRRHNPSLALAAYFGENCEPWRRFDFAAALAKCFDNYQVYRAEMLWGWEMTDRPATGDAEFSWQADLWRSLVAENADTYAAAFRRMSERLDASKVSEKYRRIAVFPSPAMPPVYLEFFRLLAERVSVYLYLFTPFAPKCKVEEQPGAGRCLSLEGHRWHPPLRQNSLAAAFGRVYDAFFAELACRGMRWKETSPAALSPPGNVLKALQYAIKNDLPLSAERQIANREDIASDHSVRIHICHNPLREVQVLHDHLRRWFAEDPSLEPRQVLVLATDMAIYAPLVQAVFSASEPEAGIPVAIADRYALSDSGITQTFLKLLRIASSRFKVSEVIDLLGCPAVSRKFDLAADELPALQELIEEAGIRWGMDANHRRQCAGALFTSATTWRCGLDRLLLGYAMGGDREEEDWRLLPNAAQPIVAARSLAEDEAERVGKLAMFLERLEWLRTSMAHGGSATAKLAEWMRRMAEIIEEFFADTPETFAELQSLRKTFAGVLANAQLAGIADIEVEYEAIVFALENEMASVETAGNLTANSVICAALRLGAAVPSRIVCVLGLGDGQFPRSDKLPSFDLLRRENDRRACDPSLRMADRAAFLEAVLAAQEKLHLSYVGRSDRDETIIPPSPLLAELKDWLEQRFCGIADLGVKSRGHIAPFEVLHHLQPFHPDYFLENGQLFSCSEWAARASRSLIRSRQEVGAKQISKRGLRALPKTSEARTAVSLEEIFRFLMNPARYYFQALGVRFEEKEMTPFTDDELFDSDSLADYLLKEAIMRALLYGKNSQEYLFEALCQRGLLPLGEQGKQILAQRMQECHEILATKICGNELRSILATPAQNQRLEINLDTGQRVDAEIKIYKIGQKTAAIYARPAELKAKDYLQGWLVHLAAAAAEFPLATYIFPREPGENGIRYSALSADEARQQIAKCLRMMQEGLRRPVPFALKTSFAFAEQMHKAASGAAGQKQKSLSAAQIAWRSADQQRGEKDDNPYLRRAFGDAGPMADSEFAIYAMEIFAPMLSAVQKFKEEDSMESIPEKAEQGYER